MNSKLLYNRFSILFSFILLFILVSISLRTVLMFITPDSEGLNFLSVCRIYLQGLVFDLGVAVLISGIYSIYLLLLPQKWNNSWLNRILTYAGFSLVLFLVLFS